MSKKWQAEMKAAIDRAETDLEIAANEQARRAACFECLVAALQYVLAHGSTVPRHVVDECSIALERATKETEK
jgi:hypothetical protein